ncbi:hypothetical protein [Streptomyces sp. NPDC051909]|uniref:hypothetical protein n=1 Tax=Streptomyces sp. NPDC051909 TaxID=3154944 RepID=UPI0034271F1C
MIDDGKAGEVSAEPRESPGKGDTAVFTACHVMRADPDSDHPRGIFQPTITDELHDAGPRKDSFPLGPAFTGWLRPDEARAVLPAGCAARMGSTAPYINVTLRKPSQEEKEHIVDRDTAIRTSTTVLREAATNLARNAGC